MKKKVEHPRFQRRPLMLESDSMFGEPYLSLDGTEVVDEIGEKTSIEDDQGETVFVSMERSSWFKQPIPNVQIEGKSIQMAEPLAWYEIVWCAAPLVLIVVGGALGGACGGAALACNRRALRSEYSTSGRFLASAAVSIAAVVIWLITATFIHLLIGTVG